MAIPVSLTAIFSQLNYRYLDLLTTIGVMFLVNRLGVVVHALLVCRASPVSISARRCRFLAFDSVRWSAWCASTMSPDSFRLHIATGRSSDRRSIVLTIAIILLVLWGLGFMTSFTAGGLLHILLVVAVIMIVYQVLTGRRVV
jgi:hypothetical protein